MTDTKIAILNKYDARPGNDNYRTEVYLNPTDRTVEIREWFGNGQTMDSFNGKEICIGHLSRADIADMADLVDFLESADTQEILGEIVAGYDERWDGSNYRGRLTEEADALVEDLTDRVNAVLADLPTYWEVDDWFGGTDVVKDMYNSGVESIEEYAADEEHKASPNILDEDEIVRYVKRKLQEAADDEDDLELANYARRLLDMPRATTLEYEQENFDLDGAVTFTRMGVIDNQEIVLVDDTQQCWLAHEASLWVAMGKLRELPSSLSAEDRNFWWYDQLCADVSHEAGAVAAFEALHGERNWP